MLETTEVLRVARASSSESRFWGRFRASSWTQKPKEGSESSAYTRKSISSSLFLIKQSSSTAAQHRNSASTSLLHSTDMNVGLLVDHPDYPDYPLLAKFWCACVHSRRTSSRKPQKTVWSQLKAFCCSLTTKRKPKSASKSRGSCNFDLPFLVPLILKNTTLTSEDS